MFQLVALRHLARKKYGDNMKYLRFLTTDNIQGSTVIPGVP